MSDPFPSMSKVYAPVLQEESHKNIGHGGSSTPQSDAIIMYANTEGILEVPIRTKGITKGRSLFVLTTT